MLHYAEHCLPSLAFEGPPPPGCPGALALVLVRRGACLVQHAGHAGAGATARHTGTNVPHGREALADYERWAALDELEALDLDGPPGGALLAPGQSAFMAPAAEGALAAQEGTLIALPLPAPDSIEGNAGLAGVALGGAAAKQFAAALQGAPALYRDDGGLFLRLWQGQCPSPGRPAMPPDRASALAYELLCTLSAAAAAEGKALSPLVAAALGEIQAHYGEVYGVEELADQLEVSKSHLIRSFTAALGTSPGKVLTAVRVEHAKRLLHSGLTLELVASMCGFSGPGYLCKVFKKETGESPRAWLRRQAPTGPPAPLGEWEEQMYL